MPAYPSWVCWHFRAFDFLIICGLDKNKRPRTIAEEELTATARDRSESRWIDPKRMSIHEYTVMSSFYGQNEKEA